MKEKNKNSIDDLIIRHLTGLTSKEEIAEFEIWLNFSEDNKKYFRKFKSVWEATSNLKEYQEIDVESSLKNVKNRIGFAKRNNKNELIWMFARIAAVFVFFLGIYLMFKSKSSSVENLKMLKVEALNGQKIAILPDSTVVTLKIASSIEYPEKFDGNERKVIFEGEAYFEVRPDKIKPFIIETSQLRVKVVGTAFNLKANTNSNNGSIFVTEGKVLFSGKTEKTKNPVSLEKGEIGIIDTEKNLLKKDKNKDLNIMSWRTGVFEFNNVLLNEALPLFSDFYKCAFEIADKRLNSYVISGKYENLKIEELIGVLEMTMNIKIEKSGQKYLLKAAN